MIKIKIKTYLSPSRFLALIGLSVLVVLSLSHTLSAQTLTQGYGTDDSLQRGMIVQIKKSDTTKVEPVTSETVGQMHGVVVDANDAPVALSSDGNKVYVANTGHYEVLVSNQAGVINPGDFITVSALNGIGMKAGSSDTMVVGKALTGFDGKANVLSSSEIKDSKGKSIPVNLSRIQADIGVGRNPLLKASDPNLPTFLKKAAESIAGKQVNTRRVYLAVLLFVVCTVTATVLMYGGIRSGIISIGRNPLSKKTIIRSILQVILTGLIIFISGLFGVYLLLKL